VDRTLHFSKIAYAREGSFRLSDQYDQYAYPESNRNHRKRNLAKNQRPKNQRLSGDEGEGYKYPQDSQDSN